MHYNAETDLRDLHVVVVVAGLFLLDHQIIDLLQEGRPHLLSTDLEHPLSVLLLDSCHA